jgi:Superfamily I DNA and RNA helicases
MDQDGLASVELLRADVGDRISHKSYGAGRVVASRDGILEILFDKGTAARILASFAGMRRLDPWEEGRISPPRGELSDPSRFAPPLSTGERDLIEMLDHALPQKWRLYVRPHLDAERPLLAAIHPDLGGMIWDVVDWQRDRLVLEGKIWTLETEDGEHRLRSPLDYLDEVRKKLYGVYLPEIGQQVADDPHRFGLVRAGLYFENEETAAVAGLGRGVYTVFGHDAVSSGDLSRVMPMLDPRGWQPAWFEQFDRVLGRVYRMPDAMSAHPISLEQDRLARPARGRELIEGVAGSGKSVVLAYRAARIAREGRRVLVLTFNRTLTNYLHAILRRMPVRHEPDLITVLHFHGLLSRVLEQHRLPKPVQGDPDETFDSERADSDWLEEAWPDAALSALRTFGVPDLLRFDAILIDEGQDFGTKYVSVLERLIAETVDPEVVIALDAAQRVYDRLPSLLDGGPWKSRIRRHRMRKGYRLPESGARVANAFAATWNLPTETIELVEGTVFPGHFDWVRVSDDGDAAAAVIATLDAWRAEPDFLAARVAVLVTAAATGEALVRLLWERDYSANHVFAVRAQGALLENPIPPDAEPEWRVGQTHKIAFAYGDSRLKVSTIHSFKGWDADRVIFVLPHESRTPSERTISELYVGLTRAREDMVVIGNDPAFGLAKIAHESVTVTRDPLVAERFRELHGQAIAAQAMHRSRKQRPASAPGPVAKTQEGPWQQNQGR